MQMSKKRTMLDDIMAWEGGEMGEEEEVEFFQELIDNGMAWTLQGCYGRNAAALLDAGLCHTKKVSLKEWKKAGPTIARQ